jgi:histone acetyltransferase (RNA polymerase elongator complex component)
LLREKERERETVEKIKEAANSVAEEVERQVMEKERVSRMNEQVNIPVRLTWDDSSDPNIGKRAISKVRDQSGRSREMRVKSSRKAGQKNGRLRQMSIKSFMTPRRRASDYIETID